MEIHKLKRKVTLLTIAVIISNIALLVLIFTGFKSAEKKEHFDEITAKRINVVDETGDSLRMVISNEDRQHPGALNGEDLPDRDRPAGMIFFNAEGDEVGGLIYDGNKEEAGMVLSVDQYKNDQIMQLQYQENPQEYLRKYGLQIWDYPKKYSGEKRMKRFEAIEKLDSEAEKKRAYQEMKKDSLLMEDRLFIGKEFDKTVGLFIKDGQGNPRIKIYIDSTDTPQIERLDKEGNKIK